MEELKHTCANCEEVFDETVKLSKCGKCKVMHYCSEECQKEDWPRHKEECTKIESVMGLNHAITSAEKVSDFDAILVALKKKCAPACGSFIVWTAQNNVEGLTHFTDNTSPNSFAIGFAKCPQCPETPYNKDEQISFTIIHKQKAYRTGYQGTHDTEEIPEIKTMPRVLVNDGEGNLFVLVTRSFGALRTFGKANSERIWTCVVSKISESLDIIQGCPHDKAST